MDYEQLGKLLAMAVDQSTTEGERLNAIGRFASTLQKAGKHAADIMIVGKGNRSTRKRHLDALAEKDKQIRAIAAEKRDMEGDIKLLKQRLEHTEQLAEGYKQLADSRELMSNTLTEVIKRYIKG